MLTLRRPFDGFFGLSRELDNVLSGGPSNNGNRIDFAPAVDIEEKEDHFLIQVDLPGVSEKDIDVKVHEGTLLLSGKREVAKEEKSEKGYYNERSYGRFCRSFTLGDGVDAGKIEATYKNGVLTVKLAKKAEVLPRQIPVSTN